MAALSERNLSKCEEKRETDSLNSGVFVLRLVLDIKMDPGLMLHDRAGVKESYKKRFRNLHYTSYVMAYIRGKK